MTLISLATYGGAHSSYSRPGTYYLEYTGTELLQAASRLLGIPADPASYAITVNSRLRGQFWLHPSYRLIDQGVNNGDSIAIVARPRIPAPASAPAPAYTPPTPAYTPPTPAYTPPTPAYTPPTPAYTPPTPAYTPPAPTPVPEADFEPSHFSPLPGLRIGALTDASATSKVVRLSDYEKLADVGQGAFGTIYKARHKKTGDLYAIKTLRNGTATADDRLSLERELDILARVDHPTILSLRGYVPADSQNPDPSIITEFMERGSVRGMLILEKKRQSPPEWDDTAKLITLYGIAVGLFVLHSHRVIHRDVKPENVLLDSNLEPHICDFGLSKFVAAGATRYQTIQGGTLQFIAPEIFEGESYDFAVDVYAYGILAYIVLTGLTPFPDATTPVALGMRVQRGERPRIPDDVAPSSRALIESCWAGAPSARPCIEQVMRALASPAFVNASIDAARFSAYQRRVVPQQLWVSGATPAGGKPRRQESALDHLIARANRGDALSQHAFAEQLMSGEGVEKDPHLASRYFEFAAIGGHVPAMAKFAICLQDGVGVKQSLKAAKRWALRAAKQGSAEGAFVYADMLEHGKGCQKNEAEAVEWHKKAADLGHEIAQLRWAMILEQGLFGVPRDMAAAIEYYKRASDAGNPHAMVFCADMLEHGRGVEKDVTAAVNLYRLAAGKGNPRARAYYGLLLMIGEVVPKDVERGKALIQQLVQEGDPWGFMCQGKVMEKGIGGCPVSLKHAYEAYKAAAEDGLKEALLKCARMRQKGIGCEADPAKAARVFAILVDDYGDPDAMAYLGVMLQHGDGVKMRVREGKEMVQAAADLGSEVARKVLDKTAKKRREKKRSM